MKSIYRIALFAIRRWAINAMIWLSVATGLISCTSSQQNNAEKNSHTTVDGAISISGAFALYPLVNVWAGEFRELYPGVRINISAGGAGKGMADVLSGAVDLGMFSRDFYPSEIEKGIWWISVTKDAVLPTLSSENPDLAVLKGSGYSRHELRRVFLTGDRVKWKNSVNDLHVYTRSDAAGAAAVWAQYLGGKGQESLRGIGVFGDPGLADAVKNDPYGIGFNNVIYIYDLKSGSKYPGMEVLPIDFNENGRIDPEEDFYDNIIDIDSAIADGRYPSPPARELFLISGGPPKKPEVKIFLNWILREGQEFVAQHGYIRLNQLVLDAQMQKLQ